MLRGLKARYETHHGVPVIADEALVAAVKPSVAWLAGPSPPGQSARSARRACVCARIPTISRPTERIAGLVVTARTVSEVVGEWQGILGRCAVGLGVIGGFPIIYLWRRWRRARLQVWTASSSARAKSAVRRDDRIDTDLKRSGRAARHPWEATRHASSTLRRERLAGGQFNQQQMRNLEDLAGGFFEPWDAITLAGFSLRKVSQPFSPRSVMAWIRSKTNQISSKPRLDSTRVVLAASSR